MWCEVSLPTFSNPSQNRVGPGLNGLAVGGEEIGGHIHLSERARQVDPVRVGERLPQDRGC